MNALSAVELCVSIDARPYLSAQCGRGFGTWSMLTEFETPHDQTGFDGFFARIGANLKRGQVLQNHINVCPHFLNMILQDLTPSCKKEFFTCLIGP